MQTNQQVTEILIPLLNPNEPEALLAALHVSEGQQVSSGDLLCTLETTKATSDLPVEGSGYIVGLRFSQGETVRAGERLCYLTSSPDWTPPVAELTSFQPDAASIQVGCASHSQP
jgi:pyruvate/2-oxoglutarate dehydrogenase complex dihydrolipoamide acyltransferase (E2) component